MRVLLRAAFDRFTGYGNDGVDLAMFMEAAGLDVIPMPIGVLPGLPAKFTRLLEKDPTGMADIAMMFAPPFDLKPWEYVHLGRKAVGYSMWEKSKIVRSDMEGHGWDMRRKTRWWSGGTAAREDMPRQRDGALDMLMVTCPMNIEAFAALDPHTPTVVVPCGIDTELYPEMPRTVGGRMRFGMCGMLNGRKDPFLVLQAWKELKEEHPEFDAILELKTSCPGLHPAIVDVYPDVMLYDRAWPQHKLIEWYGTLDVMISVSRGEGNNKPAMEFMSTGGTCIASDWSGHKNWLHPDCTYALRGTLAPVSVNHLDVLDYRVDKQHLKDSMLDCWRNPGDVRQKGRNSARWIRQAFSWERVVDQLLAHFIQVLS